MGMSIYKYQIIKWMLHFFDRVSLCSSGCPGTHSVDQAGLELRNSPASASRVLGLKACATTPGCSQFLSVGIDRQAQYKPSLCSVRG